MSSEESISTQNVTETPSSGSLMPESDLLLLYAREIYGNYYEINFPITLALCVFGLVTNFFNIVVFTRKHMRNTCNFYLTVLAVVDVLLILSQLPYTVHYLFGFRAQFSYSWVFAYIFLTFLELFSTVICNWLAVTIGISRILAVNRPLRYNKWCNLKASRIVLLILVLCGLALSLPLFALLKIDSHFLYDKYLYTKGFTDFAKSNEQLNMKLFWGGLLFMNFIPCVFLIVIDLALIVSICRFKQTNNKLACSNETLENDKQLKKRYRITVMISIILVLFLLNNLPDSALVLAVFFDAGDQKLMKDCRNATDFLRLFSMFNNSISFFIYYFLGDKKFRLTFNNIFCNKCGRTNKYSPGNRRSSTETISAESISGASERDLEVPMKIVSTYHKN